MFFLIKSDLMYKKAIRFDHTPKVFMKNARLEWCLENLDRALDLINQGLSSFPEYTRLWMMKGQLFEQRGQLSDAKRVYSDATRRCSDCHVLWILAARLEIKQKHYIRARAILESARLACPRNHELWSEAVKMEIAAGQTEYAASLLAKGLQECPSSGRLWAQSIWMESSVKRKAKCVDALKQCEHDVIVILAVAQYFWSNRSVDKARNWLVRAVKLDPGYGDAHAVRLRFEMLEGDEDQQKHARQECVDGDPRHGELWCSVSKDVRNWKLTIPQILDKVTELVEVPS